MLLLVVSFLIPIWNLVLELHRMSATSSGDRKFLFYNANDPDGFTLISVHSA